MLRKLALCVALAVSVATIVGCAGTGESVNYHSRTPALAGSGGGVCPQSASRMTMMVCQECPDGTFAAVCPTAPPYPVNGCGPGTGIACGGGPGYKPSGCAKLTPVGADQNIAAAGKNAESLNNLIAASPPLNNLAVDLYDNNALPGNVNVSASSSDGTAASMNTDLANPSNSTLDWYTDTVYSLGFDPTQVLFQELDHQYYTAIGLPPISTGPPVVASATFGGATYTFNITPQFNGTTFDTTGYAGYQHLLIYNDIVAGYGPDQSGALKEALQASNQAPTGAALTAALAHNGQPATGFSVKPQPVPGTVPCATPTSGNLGTAAYTAQNGLPFLFVRN